MKTSIVTERLVLREILPEDAIGMYELYSDPEVFTHLSEKPVDSIEEAIRVINYIRQQYTDNGIGRWAIIEKRTNSFIGWSGLKLNTETLNNHSGFYDIGYRLIKRYWGYGYATESARAVLDFGFEQLKLKEMYGFVHIENTSSIKILQKIGLKFIEEFEYKGIPHHWFKINNEEF